MSGFKDGTRRIRLGLGLAVVLVLGVVMVATAKSNAPDNNSSLKSIGRAVDVSLAPRKYQFIGQGQLQAGSGDTLMVGNLPVIVNAQTQFAGSIKPGEMVSLSGSILANQSWLVDRIEPVSDTKTFFIFAGPLESISETVWKVGGISVLINPDTAIDPGLNLQDMLLVTFSVQDDGTWLASKVESLQNNQGVIPPTKTPTPTETPAPTSTSVAPVVPAAPALKPAPPDKQKPKDPGKGHGKGGGKGHGRGGGGGGD
jgi:hypothetical protein